MNTTDLNSIYYRLYMKCMEMLFGLQHRIFETEYGWYNGHYSKRDNGEYEMDYYPIPVISVNGYCDIEINLDSVTVSTKRKKKDVLSYSFEKFSKFPFEAYGAEDYLADFYSDGMTIEELYTNVKNSDEREIGFSFRFDFDIDKDKMYEFVKLLRREGFYY